MPDNDFYLIQVSMNEELAGALKAHAAFTHVFLGDVYAEAFEQFIQHRELTLSRGQFVPYLSYPTDSTIRTVRIPPKLGKRLQEISAKDKQPVRGIAYTAFVHYAINQKLIPPAGTVQSGPPVARADPSVVELVRAIRNKKRKS